MDDFERMRYSFTSPEDALRANAERLRDQLEQCSESSKTAIVDALKSIEEALETLTLRESRDEY